MNKKILLASSAIFTFAAAALIFVGSYLAAPAQRVVAPPPNYLGAKAIEFGGIRGWLVNKPGGSGSCILLMHGIRADRSSMIARAKYFKTLGYSVLLFDFQAHGESRGKNITFGYTESRNAHAALAFLKKNATCSHTYAIGQSLGGAAALLGESPLPVDAMVLESVYPSIEEAVANRLELKLGRAGRFLAPLLYMQIPVRPGVPLGELQPALAIKKLKCPVLVIAGSRDEHTNLKEAKLLFDNAPPPKRFWVVDGAKHEDLYAYAGREYEQVVSAFFLNPISDSPNRSQHDFKYQTSLYNRNFGNQLKAGQFKVKPFVVSPSATLRRALSNHERLNRSP